MVQLPTTSKAPNPKKRQKRKPKTGSTNPPERRFEMYVPPDQEKVLRRITRHAQRQDVSRSQLIFTILKQWLEHPGKQI